MGETKLDSIRLQKLQLNNPEIEIYSIKGVPNPKEEGMWTFLSHNFCLQRDFLGAIYEVVKLSEGKGPIDIFLDYFGLKGTYYSGRYFLLYIY